MSPLLTSMPYNKMVLGILFIVLLAPMRYLGQTVLQNDGTIFYDRNDPVLKNYEDFKKNFSSDQIVALGIRDEEIFTQANIELVERLTHLVESSEGVATVMSLTSVELASVQGDTVELKPITANMSWDNVKLRDLKQRAVSHPLLAGRLISRDGTMATIMIELIPNDDKRAQLQQLDAIWREANLLNKTQAKLYFSGPPYVELELDRLLKSEFKTVGAAVIVLLLASMIWALGFRPALLYGSALMMTMLGMLGVWAAMGRTLNIVNLGAWVLVFIVLLIELKILGSIVNRFVGGQKDLIVVSRSSLLQLAKMLLTVTAAIATLLVFDLRALHELVYLSLIGLAYGNAAILCALWVAGGCRDERWCGPNKHILIRKRGAIKQRFNFHLVGVAMILLFGAGITQLKVTTDWSTYLPRGNRIIHDMLFINDHIWGAEPVEVVVSSAGDGFADPDNLRRLDSLQLAACLHLSSYFTTSLSIVDFFKEIDRAFHGIDPDRVNLPDQLQVNLEYLELMDSKLLKRTLSGSNRKARISFASDARKTDTLQRDFEHFLHSSATQKILGERLQVMQSGVGHLYHQVDKRMAAKVMIWAAWLLIVAGVALVSNLNRPTMGMVPQLFIRSFYPVVIVLGAMGWLGFSFESGLLVATLAASLLLILLLHVKHEDAERGGWHRLEWVVAVPLIPLLFSALLPIKLVGGVLLAVWSLASGIGVHSRLLTKN